MSRCLRALVGALLLLISFVKPTKAQQKPTPPDVPVPQAPGVRDLAFDTWVGVDALGRKLPTATDTHPPRRRFVGIFYFITQGMLARYDAGGHATYDEPRNLHDNTEIIRELHGDPLTKPQGWQPYAVYWWGEPAVGYYMADDPWVIRHNLQMLEEAGVDVILFDVTNALTYQPVYLQIMAVAEQMRLQGNPTPQFAFVTHSRGGYTVTKLYNDFYSRNLFPDLWFYWQGKPLILGDKNAKMDDGSPLDPKIRDFFTWRYSWAWDPGQDKWQWIDNYPQRWGWHTDPNAPEELPVAVASHPVNDIGRSYHGAPDHGGYEPPLNDQDIAADVNKGIYFQEQWDRALQVDPLFVFVTGWNEWTAMAFPSPGPSLHFLDKPAPQGTFYFVDEYNEEFSRDIMPMKGGFGDDYYMQLVENIRRYKGVRPIPIAHGFHTVPLGDFEAWQNISPDFLNFIGNTMHRDWPGWGTNYYVDNSGRNDIIEAKVACDAKNIYFYARTREKLSPYTDPNWMQLLIDSDQNPKTGWHGYDFVVNHKVLSPTVTTIQSLRTGKVWRIAYRARGNELMVIVPRSILGLTNLQKTTFDFHWVDNVPIGGNENIINFWYEGDSAPDGRFNYRFIDERREVASKR
ncbi:hypothetical protein CWRG_01830 [Chthonomonas calidirosea]|uniref:hypothetical protein n=1 Tax=Chthonomonas calidirosea TaxID=454171 RepID=UPI0006DD5401|nr:hypothetical protein [Chthonomonas calidirosea]CEK17423.1 hypothetical protein CWRG_01830 [Chthonomonas calidirosea]